MSPHGEFRGKTSTSQALARSQSKATYFKPTLAQVLSATRSLYEDELRPYGRILLKRIREQWATRCNVKGKGSCSLPSGSAAPTDLELSEVGMIDPKVLRRLCESCTELQVEPTEGKEYSVTLVGQPGVFVDPCSPQDPYPHRLWTQAAKYFEELKEEDGLFPGGRYACAQILKSRSLHFLKNRSLGEICHIVQLGISQKKLLGYSDGQLVPHGRSEECLKERAAEHQQPVVTASQQPEVLYASWEQVYEGLKALLESSTNPAPNMISLSNVKRLFRSHFNLVLSETVLGYPRVGDMLQDPRLSGLCRLEALSNGQVVIRLIESWQPPSQPMSPQSSWFQVGPNYGQMQASPSMAFQMQQSLSHQVYCGADMWQRELAMMATYSAAGSPVSSPTSSPYGYGGGPASCASNRFPSHQWGMAAAPVPMSLLTTVPQSTRSTRLATNPCHRGDAASRGAMQQLPAAQQQQQQQPQQQLQEEQQLLQLPVLHHQVHQQDPVTGWWQSEEDEAVYLHAAFVEAPMEAASFDTAGVEGHHCRYQDHECAGVAKERLGSDELLETNSLHSFGSTLASSNLLVSSTPSEAEVSAPMGATEEAGLIVRNTFLDFSPKDRRKGQKRSSSVPCAGFSA